MSQDLNAAIATASSYIAAGDPVDVACRDAAQEHGGLNPKLVQNRLLAGIGATVDTARDVLRASLQAAQAATQANAAADRARALAAAEKRFASFTGFANRAASASMVGKSFTYMGEEYLFVAVSRCRTGGEIAAISVATAKSWNLQPSRATLETILRAVAPAEFLHA